MRLITPGGRSARSKGSQEGGGNLFVGAMPRANARFRISIKDNKTRRGIKVELREAPGWWGQAKDGSRHGHVLTDGSRGDAELAENFEVK